MEKININVTHTSRYKPNYLNRKDHQRLFVIIRYPANQNTFLKEGRVIMQEKAWHIAIHPIEIRKNRWKWTHT